MSAKFSPLTETIYNYAVALRSNADDPLLKALQSETQKLGGASQMQIAPDQSSFISLLVASIGAKWAVEIGTFTGMSSISIARHLAPGGKLVCFDVDAEFTGIARRYWKQAGLEDRIELRLGDAHRLVAEFRPPHPIDFVFIDADKEAYDFYYEQLLPQVRPGGLILFDNMFRGGDVVDPVAKETPSVRATDQLNRKLATDHRVQTVLMPIADGLTICRKLPAA